MLQKIHDNLSGWVAYFILGLLAVVFIFWGIDFGFQQINYAAKVKIDSRPWWQPAEKINQEDVRQAWQNQSVQFHQLYRGEIPDELRRALQQRLLQDFVRNEILTQHTHDQGYRVSDQQVLRAIEQIPAFQIGGQFSKDTALYRLRTQGISPAQFEAEQRKYLQITGLQQAIFRSAFVTPGELEMNRRLQKEQREASWLILPAERFVAGINPDEAAIQSYYEQHQDRFMTAETVALRYVELKLEDIAREVKVSEEQLRSAYEESRDRFTDDDGNPQTFEQVREELETELRTQEAERHFGDLQERLADAAFENLNDLDAVARELGLEVKEVASFSRESGGGELGARPEIIEAAFSEHVLNGENSRPMELEPGHVVVLRVTAHRPAEPRPLEEVKQDIVAAIRKEQSERQALELAERSAGLMQAGNETLERLAGEFKTKPVGPQYIGRTDESMPIELRNVLFSTPRPPEGQAIYRPVALGNGDAAILKFSGARLDTTEETPEELQARKQQLQNRVAEAEFGAYLAELERNAKVIINPRVFE